MKAKREHRVPLCGRALEVLDAARTLGDGDGLVFPMRSGRSIASSTFPKMLQQHEVAAVPHGFRSSFRDWAAEETDHPREVIEAALAHVVQKQGRGGLREVGPVRTPAVADGRLVGVPCPATVVAGASASRPPCTGPAGFGSV